MSLVDESASPVRAAERLAGRGPRRWALWTATLAMSAAVVFVAFPALAGVPARLVDGCGDWIATAGLLELLSALGFVVLFKLVFADQLSWRRTVPAALRALAATTILPGGGLVGPAVGAWSTTAGKPSLSRLGRATTTFIVLGNAPVALVLAALGGLLWLGALTGPHHSVATIVPAAIALGLVIVAWRMGRPAVRRVSSQPRPGVWHAVDGPVAVARDGVRVARALVIERDWKLLGAVAYYAFDNAVLWATFHAFAHPPAVSVVVMGYLVGSLAGALPLPGGLGALDGGLIGALVLYGSPVAPAAAAVLLYRGLSLAVPIVLGVIGCARRSPRIVLTSELELSP